MGLGNPASRLGEVLHRLGLTSRRRSVPAVPSDGALAEQRLRREARRFSSDEALKAEILEGEDAAPVSDVLLELRENCSEVVQQKNPSARSYSTRFVPETALQEAAYNLLLEREVVLRRSSLARFFRRSSGHHPFAHHADEGAVQRVEALRGLNRADNSYLCWISRAADEGNRGLMFAGRRLGLLRDKIHITLLNTNYEKLIASDPDVLLACFSALVDIMIEQSRYTINQLHFDFSAISPLDEDELRDLGMVVPYDNRSVVVFSSTLRSSCFRQRLQEELRSRRLMASEDLLEIDFESEDELY